MNVYVIYHNIKFVFLCGFKSSKVYNEQSGRTNRIYIQTQID